MNITKLILQAKTEEELDNLKLLCIEEAEKLALLPESKRPFPELLGLYNAQLNIRIRRLELKVGKLENPQ